MSEVQPLSPGPGPPARLAPRRRGESTAMALARIYRPWKRAMEAGRAQTRKWLLEYEPATRRDPDPLMGWASARDTLNEVKMRFPTLDEAVAFAEEHGLQYTIIHSHTRTPKAKSYADNFPYDRIRT